MQEGFQWIDFAILAIYLAVLVAMGAFFAIRENSTERFFLGGRSIPWWAVGISIFGTQLSAITYIAIPARAYATDWSWLIVNLGIPVVGVIVVLVFLPVYRKNQITSVYEFLETRFGVETRVYGALAFIVMHIGRMSIILFLPSLALSYVTNMPVSTMILVMGVLVTVYTVLGGIEAVIWTDVIQVIILLFGALISLFVIFSQVDGGMAAVISTGYHAGKMRMVHLSAETSQDIVWILLLGSIFGSLVPYAADQTVVQRYFTTKNDKEARNCLLLGTFMSVPASLLFFFLGTALFVYYGTFPERLGSDVEGDRIYPYFLVHALPTGITGIVIAAIFAASMSSLDSSLNSISTVCITDFYKRFMCPDADDRKCLSLARCITIIVGAFSTLTALYVAQRIMNDPEQRGAWEAFAAIQSLLGGGLAGVFCLGIFCKRANQAGAVAALVICTACLAVVKYELEWHVQTYAAISLVVVLVAGTIVSYITTQSSRISS